MQFYSNLKKLKKTHLKVLHFDWINQNSKIIHLENFAEEPLASFLVQDD